MKFLLFTLSASAVLLTTSCNTFIGIGRDLRLAGQGVENFANKSANKGGEQTDTSAAPVY